MPVYLVFSDQTSFSMFSHKRETSRDINNTSGPAHLKSIVINSYYTT